MSAYQPIDIKPLYGRKWVTNGVNINFKTYKDAYDDSPTNASINQCVCKLCVYGEGMIDKVGSARKEHTKDTDNSSCRR
jgi:hypothetical protein